MALYVEESGPYEAPTILFLHGGGGGIGRRPQGVPVRRSYRRSAEDRIPRAS